MVLTSNLLSLTRSDVKDDLEARFTHGSVGTATPTGLASQTAVPSEAFRSEIDSFDKSVSDSITSTLEISAAEANGNTLRSFGWFSTSVPNAGTALAVDSVTALNKTSDFAVVFDTSIQILVTET